MKPLTRIKALEYCQRLWTWLAANPDKTKLQWPGWKRFKKPSPMANHCPCCEYTLQRLGMDGGGTMPMSCGGPWAELYGPEYESYQKAREWIKFCPLKTLWPKGCCYPGTPYDTFNRISGKTTGARARAAQKIADACRKLLRTKGKTNDRH